jgi:tryptophan synthase alpha chain
VGFGIHSPETAAQVATVADAVIVGSVLVKRIEEFVVQPERILTEVPAFLAGLRQSMDRASSRSSTRASSGASV